MSTGVGNEVGGVGKPNKSPCNAYHPHHQRHCRSDRNGSGGIIALHHRNARCDHDGKRRGRTDRKLSTGAEQRVDNAGDEITKKAGDGWKIGERRVGERFRDDERGQRQARDQVEAKPSCGVRREPAQGIQPTFDPRNPL